MEDYLNLVIKCEEKRMQNEELEIYSSSSATRRKHKLDICQEEENTEKSNQEVLFGKYIPRMILTPYLKSIFKYLRKKQNAARPKLTRCGLGLYFNRYNIQKSIKIWKKVQKPLEVYRWTTTKELKLQDIKDFESTFLIDDETMMRNLGFGISQNFSKIRKLNISFGGALNCFRHLCDSMNPKVTDKGLEVLITKVSRHLVSLDQLSLCFSYSRYKITNKGVEILASEIGKELTNLTSLSLKFAYLDDQDLRKIGVKICRRLTKLKSFQIETNTCQQVTSKGIEKLIWEIANHLPTLQSVSLGFPQCNGVNDKVLEFFMMNINKHLLHMKFLKLYIWGCKQVTKRGLEIFRSMAAEKFRFDNLEIIC